MEVEVAVVDACGYAPGAGSDVQNRVRGAEGETRTCPGVVSDRLLERALADGREVLEPLVLCLFALLARVEQ